MQKRLLIIVMITYTLFTCKTIGQDVISSKLYRKEYKAINYLLKKTKKERDTSPLDSYDRKVAFDLIQYQIYNPLSYIDKDGNKKQNALDFFSEGHIYFLEKVFYKDVSLPWFTLKRDIDLNYISAQAKKMKKGVWDASKIKKHIDTLVDSEKYTRYVYDNNISWRKELSIVSYSLPIISKNGKYMFIREGGSFQGHGSEQINVYKKKGKDWEFWFYIPD